MIHSHRFERLYSWPVHSRKALAVDEVSWQRVPVLQPPVQGEVPAYWEEWWNTHRWKSESVELNLVVNAAHCAGDSEPIPYSDMGS
jgi:hypothetical protein